MAETETFVGASGELHDGTGFDLAWTKPGTDPAAFLLDAWDDGTVEGLGASADSGSGDTYYLAPTAQGTDAMAYGRIRDLANAKNTPICAKLQDSANYASINVVGTGSVGTRIYVEEAGVVDDGDVRFQGADDQWIKVEAESDGTITGFTGGTAASPDWDSAPLGAGGSAHGSTAFGAETNQGLVCPSTASATFGSELAKYYEFTFDSIGGGGTTFTQSVSGSVTPAGALTRKTMVSFAGSITPIGRVFKKSFLDLAGSITATGALATRVVIQHAISGSITPAGALAKKTMKSLGGSITATGALARKTKKALSGSITAAGALVKKTAKSFAGSITATGALASGFKSFQAISGSITAAGSVAGSLIVGVASQANKFVGFIKNVGRGMMR